MADFYFTLSTSTTGYLREKASKFHAFAYPVKSVADVEARLKELGKEFFDARHICYAYRLGPNGETWRANDAGEPSHSAGDPILNELKSKGVSDALCVVIRYFGGTKLGVGGLIKAYSEAAKLALDQNPPLRVNLTKTCTISFPYERTGDVNRILHKFGWNIQSSDFQSDCRFVIETPASEIDVAKGQFTEIGILVS